MIVENKNFIMREGITKEKGRGNELGRGLDVWMCGACQHINFKKREACQRCGLSKYGDQVDTSAYGNANRNNNEVLAGDWYCQAVHCGAHNYASRMICFRCGAQRPNSTLGANSAAYEPQANLPGWKPGDWICTRPGCGVHNYACRMECFKCMMPRDFGGMY